MVLRNFIVLIPLFTLFACGTDGTTKKIESEEEIVVIPNGAELYVQQCAVCHGSDGKLGSSGAKDLTKSKLSDPEILSMIANGKNAMPPMQVPLGSDDNVSAVVEYIKGMRK